MDADTTGQLMAEILKLDFVRSLNDPQLLVWAQIVGNAGTRCSSSLADSSFGINNGLAQFIRDNIRGADPQLSKAAVNAANGLKVFWQVKDDLTGGAYEEDTTYGWEAEEIRGLLNGINFLEIEQRYRKG